MEFRIDKDTFLKALQKVQGIVERRNTMPILSNVLIEASPDRLYITATDLEVGMKSSYPTEVVTEGKITVSAKKVYEIIKELSDEKILFSTKENDWVEIRCGKALFNIVGLSPEEFPYFPKVNDDSFIKLNSAILREMIENTSYAICHDETKYNLNGVLVKALEENGRGILRMVATDGHRLSIAEKEMSGTISRELAKGIIFPKKGIFELKKMTEEEDEELAALGSCVRVSALTGAGLDALRRTIREHLLGGGQHERDSMLVTNLRHNQCLEGAAAYVRAAAGTMADGLSEEFVIADLRRGLDKLGEITGITSNEEILGEIFRRFCIGK